MRIVENLAIAWLITSGPGWPWNMVAGYWLLILRLIRWLIAAGNRNPETLRLPVWRVVSVSALVLTAFGIFALAMMVPSSSSE